ncbi:MAG TPA: glycosyltransferase family 39 protein, partial [Flavobacteriales bacterium]|nr:glycosyltransferase family 39 protein [Flavobacteriales bacterium]
MLKSAHTEFLIAALALLLFVPGLGAVNLFDWDEINFAEIAREMLVTDDPLQPRIAFQPFYEKPPLFMWMQALCMKVFGVGEFAARLPNAICGAVTLLTLYRMGSRLRNGAFGLLWVLAYLGSILPNLYFRSGIIDPWFNLFIFAGLHAYIRAAGGDGPRHAALCGLWLGLAVLTKGPVAVLIPGITVVVYALRQRRWPMVWIRTISVAAPILLLTIGTWAVADLLRNGPDFMSGFFWRQVAMLTTEDAGHGGFLGYHFVVLLLGCFPASLFAIHEMTRRSTDSDRQREHRRWMIIL